MDSKQCNKCGCPLIIGDNWTEARQRNRSYICGSCQYEKCKEWRADNRKRNILNAARQRAVKEGLPFDITEDDFELPDVCPVLGIPLEFAEGKGHYTSNSPSLDKFDPSAGYVKGNVAVISMKANRMKNDATIEEVERLLHWMRHF
jgi:hypothetical protein